MNQTQKQVVANYTCGILDHYDDMESFLKSHGADRKTMNKMKKAFDLIFEVNQEMFRK